MNTVAVIGLGYVGLPLVVEFGKHLRTIGFDIRPIVQSESAHPPFRGRALRLASLAP